jgi:hypothetical protein
MRTRGVDGREGSQAREHVRHGDDVVDHSRFLLNAMGSVAARDMMAKEGAAVGGREGGG